MNVNMNPIMKTNWRSGLQRLPCQGPHAIYSTLPACSKSSPVRSSVSVDASHNYERTHIDALTATTNWVLAYLLS